MHKALGTSIHPPFPEGFLMIQFAMGCFWGAERMFWQHPGIYTTHVGYSGGFTQNPSYEEVCSGNSGHTEVVRVVYDPARVQLKDLLKIFWEGHDPTQGNRQGNDRGSQYRSAIYVYTPEQYNKVQTSKDLFQTALTLKGFGQITTEIAYAKEFYYAESYHQQYLHTRPNGYCGHGHTGAKLNLSNL